MLTINNYINNKYINMDEHKNIIGFFNFQFLVTHVTTAITCVTRIFKGYPR